MPASTYAYFNQLLRNTKELNFTQSKYNLVLKMKMEKQKLSKEGDCSFPLPASKGTKKETIEFRGDF